MSMKNTIDLSDCINAEITFDRNIQGPLQNGYIKLYGMTNQGYHTELYRYNGQGDNIWVQETITLPSQCLIDDFHIIFFTETDDNNTLIRLDNVKVEGEIT